MKLPPIRDTRRYAGLYVYDFGTHVSVGYTAGEIGVLRRSAEHRHGTAYVIYRVTEEGGMELRGVGDERIGAREAMAFLRADAQAARSDYDTLRKLAGATPPPCTIEARLGKVYNLTLPNVSTLLYPAAASVGVSAWLAEIGFRGGDTVSAGPESQSTNLSGEGLQIDSCRLAGLTDDQDRSAEAVLAAVAELLQR